MVLVVDDARQDLLQDMRQKLIDVLEDHTKLIIDVDKFRPKHFLNENRTIETDPMGTDVWFYAIDPKTQKILPRNHSLVARYDIFYS